MSWQLAVARFNSNINYSGLVHAVTEDGWFKENKVGQPLALQIAKSACD